MSRRDVNLGTDLRAVPEFLRDMLQFDGETTIGWRALTERTTGEPCDKGCLAHGSSPHWHTRITGYQLVTTNGIYEFRVNGVCVRASVLHSTITDDNGRAVAS